ncbi:PREDICTED: carbohydrate sulfotransferase 9-like [Nanorana parkeri]|uniref:carbohydrate sulfotransferase 9-like n=1 Tax=Nanorana parkeri TaxID=125878 RepID=UPI000854E70F|nr:PREDICTED: carbohydrate sulfotransferase 9-like [Nanorana parkeri]
MQEWYIAHINRAQARVRDILQQARKPIIIQPMSSNERPKRFIGFLIASIVFATLGPPPAEVNYKHRSSLVKFVCEKDNLNNISFPLDRKVIAQLYVEHSHKFIYCEVPKVGCSNWKRIILLLNDSLGLSASELKHYEVHSSRLLRKLSSYPRATQEELLANYTKVMFTRDPLQRVVSAYRDKFLHEDDVYYSKTIAGVIKRRLKVNSTGPITFQQFVSFIVVENPSHRDTHWKPMFQLCDPCRIQYDVIGKFESMTQDAEFVLKTIKAPKDMRYPSLKHHANDSRTNGDITEQYLKTLPHDLYRRLLNVYSVDFSMFDYGYYDDLGAQTTTNNNHQQEQIN